MGGWSDFDYDLAINKVDRARSSRDPGTGLPVAPSETVTVIQGSIDFSLADDEDRNGFGLVKEGNAILYTEAELVAGDRVNVPLNPSVTEAWRVMGVENNYRFIHTGEANRIGYILEKEADS